MSGPGARQSLSDIDEASLLPIARLADRLLREHSLLTPGHRPVAGRVGRGMEFLDHADYVAGDDVRRIDWRASARRNRPQIRRFHDERHADWTICIDHSSSMVVPGAEKWSLAAHLGACLGYVLLHLGNRVGAITFADAVVRSLPFGSGRGQYGRLLRMLALPPPPSGAGSRLAACGSRLPTLAPVIVISDFLAEDAMLADLGRLAASGRQLHVLPIVDGRDTDPGTTGRLRLVDAESGRARAVTVDAALVATAAAQRARQLDALRRQCVRWQLPCTPCPVDRGWRSAALAHLAGLRHA